jgi:phospholipid transport system substrate-binding protein
MKMKMMATVTALFILAGIGLLSQPARAETPSGQIRAMLGAVMNIQTDPQLQGPEFRNRRREAIKKIIAHNFNFEAMPERALGPYWKKLDEADRAEFKALFQDLFQESYTRLVLDFLRQEKVHYDKEEVRQGQALVKTTIVRVNEEIPVDYTLATVQGRWQVEDVSIDGASIVRNYQRSFARVIQRESCPSLLQKMRLQKQAKENPA